MSRLFKQFIISIALQLLCSSLVYGQKYQNGTRLLKGAEVLSATPLQLDYVLKTLSDTAKIVVHIHEGKTHLILDDGSGKWREWWYYMGLWQPKTMGGASPAGKDGSIQTKAGDNFSGSSLGINDGFILSLDPLPADIGLNNKNATIRVTPHGQTVMEATYNGVVSNIYVSANDTEQNISWISKHKRGAGLRMDTVNLTHHSLIPDYWNFRSSLIDTTFYVHKRIRFNQPNTGIYTKNGNLHLSDASGDYALSDLAGSSSGMGSVSSVGLSMPPIFTVTGSPVTSSGTLTTALKSQTKNTVLAAPANANGLPAFRALLESDIPGLHWNKITNTPTLLTDYGITNTYTKTETDALLNVDIPGNDYQLLMLYNKRPKVIPRAIVSNQPTYTQFIFSGYNNYPESDASVMVDATGFDFRSRWMARRTTINTRSGQLDFSVDNNDNRDYYAQILMDAGAISQTANTISQRTENYYVETFKADLSAHNTFWIQPEEASFRLRKKQGAQTEHTNIKMDHNGFTLSKGLEENATVQPTRYFNVGDNLFFDRYLSYATWDTTLRVLNAINLAALGEPNAARISLTKNNDIQLSSAATKELEGQTEITLTEMIQKGQFYTQASEPAIADNSFAFWISGSDFYLILRSKGIQKKLRMEN